MKGPIEILYFSGVGGTRLAARLLAELLSESLSGSGASGDRACRATSIADPRAAERAASAGFLVLCYPTYYLRPAPSMREFIERLAPLDPPRPAYLVTTYELYTENSLRACARALAGKGIRTAGSAAIRAPGTDVTCVLPSRLCPWLYRFGRNAWRKLRAIAREIEALSALDEPPFRVPAPKLYTPCAQLLQVTLLNRFDAFRYRLRALPDRCDGCGACAASCGRGAWRMEGRRPVLDPERCELCSRCVHRCPRRAIVLVEALKDNPRLDGPRFAALEAEAREAIARAAPGAGAGTAAAAGPAATEEGGGHGRG